MRTILEEITTVTTTTETRRTVVLDDNTGPGLAAFGPPTVELHAEPLTDWAPVIDIASRRSAA